MEQTKGSTLTRQIANCTAAIERFGWELVEAPLIDRGRSAYTGDNIRNGRLGEFAKRVSVGAIAPGSILVVEELDRLSRQPADIMLAWLSPLIRAGLTIFVTQTNQTIDVRMLDHDMGGLMMLLITAFGSNTESRKKSERIGSAWASKREQAREGKTVQRNHHAPHWLTTVKGEWAFLDGAKDIIESIFRQRLAGAGKAMIAKRLNEAGLQRWGGHGKPSGPWNATYVGRILVNRAVLGEWQPYRQARKDTVRTPAGEPISGYYPRIISDADFARANENRSVEQAKHQGRGYGLSNLLGTKARCRSCGGQMVAKGSSRERFQPDGTVTRHYFLYCDSAKSGGGCSNQRGWTYDRVETPLLDRILTLAMDDVHFAQADHADFEAAVYAAKAKVDEIGGRMARVLGMVEAGDEVAEARYRALRVEYDAAKLALKEAEKTLAEKRGAADSNAHTLRVKEVREQMKSSDAAERFQARLRVKTALAEIIESITFYQQTGNVRVMLVDRLRMFHISHAGELMEDFDLQTMSADDRRADGSFGTTETRFGGVATVNNVLTPEEDAAAKAYARRKREAA
jgi:DNA invertase Pin-like site-specific DNA recombinase